jgi:hypothetical protein
LRLTREACESVWLRKYFESFLMKHYTSASHSPSSQHWSTILGGGNSLRLCVAAPSKQNGAAPSPFLETTYSTAVKWKPRSMFHTYITKQLVEFIILFGVNVFSMCVLCVSA